MTEETAIEREGAWAIEEAIDECLKDSTLVNQTRIEQGTDYLPVNGADIPLAIRLSDNPKRGREGNSLQPGVLITGIELLERAPERVVFGIGYMRAVYVNGRYEKLVGERLLRG